MARLEDLRKAQLGWDNPNSQPLHPEAEENYLQFLVGIDESQSRDAEPMLTDEGFIRMEWRRDDHCFVAEIGPEYLYLCHLTPSHLDDSSWEGVFDIGKLNEFFNNGELPLGAEGLA